MVRQVDPDLMDRLRDDRGNRLVFLSHRLLDETVRYLGGAFHSGAVPETPGLLASGIGIGQHPCSEARSWGGVHEPAMALGHGLRDSRLYRCRRPLFLLSLPYTRVRYWLLARQVAPGPGGDRAVRGRHRRESCGRCPELIREAVRVAGQTAAA